MAHKRKKFAEYRKRKYERMLKRLAEIEYMTLPSIRPGKSFKAANVMFDRSEVHFLQKVLKADLERRTSLPEYIRAKDIQDAVEGSLAQSRQRRRERMAQIGDEHD